jgi:2-polyprenyl-3-methyl-5-hydroxy-6-metoxy-1,4-benzoquinol methylase
MRLETDPRTLYAEHERFGVTSKGLMIPDEWRYTGRVGVALGLLALLSPSSVLDVGCGYGDVTLGLGPTCYYVGIDYTAWIVEAARQRYPVREFQHIGFDRFHSEQIGEGGFGVVVALGILATVPPEELTGFLARLRHFATNQLVLSYLDAERYDGKLQAWALADIDRLMRPHARRVTIPVHAPGDASNCTVVYETRL